MRLPQLLPMVQLHQQHQLLHRQVVAVALV